MTDPRADIFAFMRGLKGSGLTQDEVNRGDALLDALNADKAAAVIGGVEGLLGGLRPSVAAFSIIKEFEGYARALPDGRCQAYPDPGSGGDPWTIGFGSTGPGIAKGLIWSRQQAEERLEADVIKFAAGVAKRLEGGGATSQCEFDAMVSLAYNIGLGNFEKSTLLRKHRAGDKAGAAAQFAVWNKAAGRVMAGLTRRRAAEAALYRGQK